MPLNPRSASRELDAALGGRYTIERELGGGGMSRVFLAVETALARKVVIKVLPHDVAHELSAERFEREIRVAAQSYRSATARRLLCRVHLPPLVTLMAHSACSTTRESERSAV